MLILWGILYLVSVGLVIFGGTQMDMDNVTVGIPCLAVGLVWVMIGWIPFCGLKLLNPGEALVLTLFGNYIGTLKGDGFYWVNPFCSAVNPAAKTKLSQSGDVDSGAKPAMILTAQGANVNVAEAASKKISTKIMTLNNARQKINDCLGNPIEIGIAVTWRVVDCAKAVFAVDNYKEYMSLQWYPLKAEVGYCLDPAYGNKQEPAKGKAHVHISEKWIYAEYAAVQQRLAHHLHDSRKGAVRRYALDDELQITLWQVAQPRYVFYKYDGK
jgi:hypothetical protein